MNCRILILVLAVLVCSSCTPVQPWEKEYLAKSSMAFDPDPLEAQFRRHVYQSNEASGGGYSVGVGSCGCYYNSHQNNNISISSFGPFCRVRETDISVFKQFKYPGLQ